MTDSREKDKNVPSQESTLDTEGYEDCMEEHLTDVEECRAELIIRRARSEIDKARRESELESMSLNTTTEALDPGEEIEWGISPEEEDGTQRVESNVKMGVVDRMMMGDNFVIPTHAPKGSHTTPRNDETEQETDVGAAMDHPDELPQTGPRVSMSCTHVLCVFKTEKGGHEEALQPPPQETPTRQERQPKRRHA